MDRLPHQNPQHTLRLGAAMGAPVPVVCLCGPSAAGKSVLAERLRLGLLERQLPSLVIACDNYYRAGWDPHGPYGFDTPDAIDLECLRHELGQARQRQATALRHYDMGSRRVSQGPIRSDYAVILLEGAYGPQAIRQEVPLAALLYVETALSARLLRKLRRDRRERGRSTRSVIQQALFQTLPGEQRFIKPLRQQADLVIRHPDRQLPALLQHLQDLLAPNA